MTFNIYVLWKPRLWEERYNVVPDFLSRIEVHNIDLKYTIK